MRRRANLPVGTQRATFEAGFWQAERSVDGSVWTWEWRNARLVVEVWIARRRRTDEGLAAPSVVERGDAPMTTCEMLTGVQL